MKKKKIIIIVLIIILSLFLSIYLYYENTKLYISEYNVINNKVANDFDNYKIVQISDLHNTKSKTLIKSLTKEIKKQKPNIIVITGDLIDSKKYDLQLAVNFIKEIKDIAPIYFVSGNHEFWSKKYEEINSILTEEGVIILDNKFDKIIINDDNIIILGLKDPSFYPREISNQINYDLKETIDKIDNSNCFKLLLSHRPELFGTYVENDIDLVLTGHAHGGQIRIPLIGGLIAPDQGLFPKYTSGIFTKNNTSMIVSRGIGNSILPFRINNRPELVIITLNSK